jgi:hypothetical protein
MKSPSQITISQQFRPVTGHLKELHMKKMTVKQLIAKLMAMPQDSPVVMNIPYLPSGLYDVRQVGTLQDNSVVYIQ